MASDVVNAIREQNVQVAGGIIGAQPVATPAAFQLIVNVHGRLDNEDEFGDIMSRAVRGRQPSPAIRRRRAEWPQVG
jgi:multidrug efflux pump